MNRERTGARTFLSASRLEQVRADMAVCATGVAQIFNLLYRRIAFGKASVVPPCSITSHALRIENPRYSRLKICATNERFMGSFDLQHWTRIGAMNQVVLVLVLVLVLARLD